MLCYRMMILVIDLVLVIDLLVCLHRSESIYYEYLC